MTGATSGPQSAESRRILVAGAGLGGLRAAERLRAAGWSDELVVVGEEAHLPYNRPPLTKETLRGEPRHDQVELRRRRSTEDVDWRLGRAVEAVDLDARTARLSDGTTLGWTGLVVATGVRPRRLVTSAGQPTQVLRTLDDAVRLRAGLVPGARVVVVGAGFLGCEIAASATVLGARVTVVDPCASPLLQQLGPLLGEEMRRRHEELGTRFRLGRTVSHVEDGPAGSSVVHLDDGSVLPADVVVEAVGSTPNVALLQDQGLDLSDGVLCDDELHPLRDGAPVLDVVAVGDVARLPLAAVGGPSRRVEHWAMAGESATHAAQSLMAGLEGRSLGTPFAVLPGFWSEQHGIRLQSFGLPAAGHGDVRVLEGDLGSEAAVGYHDAHGLVGVVMVGMTSRLLHFGDLVAEAMRERTTGVPAGAGH